MKSNKKPSLIVGCGKTGLSVLTYFLSRNEPCVIGDDSPLKVKALLEASGISTENIPMYSFQEIIDSDPQAASFSQAVVSPGIPPHHSIIRWCKRSGLPETSELEIALHEIQRCAELDPVKKRPLILGVTGTNGKTTTVELITHILNSVGSSAESFGNIGRPLIELVTPTETQDKEIDVYVVELSSYQIERISKPLFNGCIWLNITPDHLDWHGSFEEYSRAKERLIHLLDTTITEKLRFKKPVAVLHESLPAVTIPKDVFEIRYALKGNRKLGAWTEGDLFFVKEGSSSASLPSTLRSQNHPAPHDVENFLAAALLVHSLGYSLDAISSAYSTFKKGPHRIQYICSHENVDFYDDSKGTNIHATLAAVESIPHPIVLIAGGVHKGHPYTEWRDLFQKKVISVFAIGQAKEAIAQDLGDVVDISFSNSLLEATSKAFEQAKKYSCKNSEKTVVLLSPGCSSFDMFKDYKDRGEQFQKIAKSLSQE